MSSKKTLRKLVGQMLVVGVEGTHLTPIERAWIRLLQPGGIILFRRNIEDVKQTRELLRMASEHSASLTFRCVDVEGGFVDRLRDVMVPMPSASAVAATGSEKLWRRHGELVGHEIRALGFNTTLAPVLDLALPASSAVMRTRTTSPDPSAVAAYASEFLQGLRTAAALGCGKHFPGLGAGNLDSHKATPVITRSWNELWQSDMLPYRKLARALPMVMVSHACYPVAATDQVPASVSRFWIGDVLRKKIGYRGLIISDDMEMGGILTQTPIEAASISAVLAGTDLIEICSDAALILKAYEALLSEAEKSSAFRKRVKKTARRLAVARRTWVLPDQPMASRKAMERLRKKIRDFGTLVEAKQRGTS